MCTQSRTKCQDAVEKRKTCLAEISASAHTMSTLLNVKSKSDMGEAECSKYAEAGPRHKERETEIKAQK